MNANVHRQLNRRKRRILRRIENRPGVERSTPMMTASNILISDNYFSRPAIIRIPGP